jgi:streptogramin lyase
MKRGIALFALGSALTLVAAGADFSGYIIDQACSSKPDMKGNEACARKCIKGGSPAVLLSADNKVYKLDDHKVKVTGALDGDTIKVETIQIDSGCVPGPTGCQ